MHESVTVMRPAAELYQFWLDFEQLPRFMHHLVSVNRLDERRSHWVAKAPVGRKVEWDAEIIENVPNKMISWRTVGTPDVVSAGSVHLDDRGVDRGTIVRARLQYTRAGRQSRILGGVDVRPGAVAADSRRSARVPTARGGRGSHDQGSAARQAVNNDREIARVARGIEVSA